MSRLLLTAHAASLLYAWYNGNDRERASLTRQYPGDAKALGKLTDNIRACIEAKAIGAGTLASGLILGEKAAKSLARTVPALILGDAHLQRFPTGERLLRDLLKLVHEDPANAPKPALLPEAAPEPEPVPVQRKEPAMPATSPLMSEDCDRAIREAARHFGIETIPDRVPFAIQNKIAERADYARSTVGIWLNHERKRQHEEAATKDGATSATASSGSNGESSGIPTPEEIGKAILQVQAEHPPVSPPWEGERAEAPPYCSECKVPIIDGQCDCEPQAEQPTVTSGEDEGVDPWASAALTIYRALGFETRVGDAFSADSVERESLDAIAAMARASNEQALALAKETAMVCGKLELAHGEISRLEAELATLREAQQEDLADTYTWLKAIKDIHKALGLEINRTVVTAPELQHECVNAILERDTEIVTLKRKLEEERGRTHGIEQDRYQVRLLVADIFNKIFDDEAITQDFDVDSARKSMLLAVEALKSMPTTTAGQVLVPTAARPSLPEVLKALSLASGETDFSNRERKLDARERIFRTAADFCAEGLRRCQP